MSGCDFQKKSFSVAMGSYAKGDCSSCGGAVNIRYRYNGEVMCKECFSKLPDKEICGFNTPKDRLYNFHSAALNIDIESKSQWKRELKKRGLSDNFEQSEKGRVRDIEKSASEQHSQRKHQHQEVKNSVRDALKGMNMYSREKLFIPKKNAPTRMVYR